MIERILIDMVDLVRDSNDPFWILVNQRDAFKVYLSFILLYRYFAHKMEVQVHYQIHIQNQMIEPLLMEAMVEIRRFW